MAPKVEKLTVEEFATLNGVTSQRIYQLIQAGMPHRNGEHGTEIVPREALRWWRDREKVEALAEKALNEAQERARKIRAEADMKELQLAAIRGTLIQPDEAISFVESFIGGFASASAGQLGRFEREFVKKNTAADARKLRNAIHRALMESAQRYADEMSEFIAKIGIVDVPPIDEVPIDPPIDEQEADESEPPETSAK